MARTQRKHMKKLREITGSYSMKTLAVRLLFSAFSATFSAELLAANLTDLNAVSLPGDKVELKLTFDEPVQIPKGYVIDQPARIALDLAGVSNKLGRRQQELAIGQARSVNIIEAAGRTRLVINMASMMPYASRVDGNHMYVTLGEESLTSAPAPYIVPQSEVSYKPKINTSKSIRNIDFRRGEAGSGEVVIELSSPNITPVIEEKNGKIEVSFAGVELPDNLRVQLDVQDFATPVHFVEAKEQAGKTTIEISPSSSGYEYLAFQTDGSLVIGVKEISAADKERIKVEQSLYTGEKLSLNFQDIEVRSVLQLIADFQKLNLVASDTVQGNITLHMQNVPWDQALELVLKTKGLDKRQVGNVLLIAPAAEISAREQQELEAKRQIAELAPLRREVVQVNYAKASDIAALFQSVTSTDGRGDERGSITVDDRTNNIIAYQTQERLEELRRIVAQLDIPVRQVMIEARIVEANVDFEKSIGVRWGGNLWAGSSNKWNAWGKDGNMGIADDDFAQGKPGDLDFRPSRRVGHFDGVPELPFNSPFVDMGVTGSTSGIGIGFITNNAVLDLQLSAMEKTGNGEVVSQPKVVTSDKETAKILKGSEVPYQEASSSGATSTSFKEAALMLEVTPQITPDNRIIMEVKVAKDEPDFANALNGVPPIKKNEVNAKVLVADGETIVIGGVFSNTQSKGVDKVPVLGDIPYLGRLFRRDTIQDRKSELLVFITPRIMNNQSIQVSR